MAAPIMALVTYTGLSQVSEKFYMFESFKIVLVV